MLDYLSLRTNCKPMSLTPLSILLGMVAPFQLMILAFVLLAGLVGLSTLGFVKYSKTKQTGWAVLGAMCGALFLLIIIAAILIVNEKPWLNR